MRASLGNHNRKTGGAGHLDIISRVALVHLMRSEYLGKVKALWGLRAKEPLARYCGGDRLAGGGAAPKRIGDL